MRGKILTVKKGTPSGFKVSTSFNGSKTVINVSGTIKESDKARYIYRKAWEPVENFGSSFTAACKQVGIKCINTKVKEGSVSAGSKPFYTFNSEHLSKHITGMFKYSNNFIAEMIFKTISKETLGDAGSWSGGVQAVKSWVKIINPDFGDFDIVNGSGMSNRNRATPEQVERILSYAADQSSWGAEFISALPIAGVDGTLKSRFSGSNLNGIMRAKTGTLNSYGVSNLAGYVFTPKGRYSFTFLINDKSKGLTTHWDLQEQVLGRLFEEL